MSTQTPDPMNHEPSPPPVDPGTAEKVAPRPSPHPVEITVNTRAVTMPDKEATGLDIKEAAVAQGVPIKLDFVLMAQRGESDRRDPVADDDLVHLHPNQHFFAIAPDDNS